MDFIVGIAIDAILVLIVVLLVIKGVKRGFIKQIRGLISTLIVIAIAAFAVVPITDAIVQPSWQQGVGNAIESPLLGFMQFEEPNLNLFYIFEENDLPPVESGGRVVYGLVFRDSNGQVRRFEDLLTTANVTDRPFFTRIPFELVMESIILPNASNYLRAQEEALRDGGSAGNPHEDQIGITLTKALSDTAAMWIFYAVFFIVLTILFQIVWWLLMKLFKKLVATLYVAFFFNKFFGGAFGVAIGGVIIFAISTALLALVHFLNIEVIATAIESTYIMRFVSELNPWFYL